MEVSRLTNKFSMPIRRVAKQSCCIWLLITNIISSILVDSNIVDGAFDYVDLISCELWKPFLHDFLDRFGIFTVDDWVQKPETFLRSGCSEVIQGHLDPLWQWVETWWARNWMFGMEANKKLTSLVKHASRSCLLATTLFHKHQWSGSNRAASTKSK